jgi:anthranilate synthase component 1
VVGYVDWSGNLDTAIAIRTMFVRPERADGKRIASLQAGAGIVADSDPAAEFRETEAKARAVLTALALAARDPLSG